MKRLALVWIWLTLVLTGCTKTSPANNLDDFAQCLTDKWVIMYGSVTCPHCQSQKAMFGSSFQYINYVECTKEFDRCANLKWVPTWEISSGNYLEWLQQLSTLATATTCKMQ